MSNKITTAERDFVGVWISRQSNSFLSLFALSTGVSKSKVIRDMAEKWAEKEKNDHIVQDLITVVTEKYQRAWEDRKQLFGITDTNRFIIYKEDLAIRFKRRGIKEHHIEQIIAGIHDETLKET